MVGQLFKHPQRMLAVDREHRAVAVIRKHRVEQVADVPLIVYDQDELTVAARHGGLGAERRFCPSQHTSDTAGPETIVARERRLTKTREAKEKEEADMGTGAVCGRRDCGT